MSYSLDLRERVIEFVQSGGSKSEASRRFSIGRQTIYHWLSLPSLAPVKLVRRRKRKLDWEGLRRDVDERPDAMLKERAAKFGVRISSIEYACKEMGISHKKNTALQRKVS
jgi:transposase